MSFSLVVICSYDQIAESIFKMDAISIAASIAGLITLADIIVVRGYKYIKDVKNAEISVATLIDEVNKLSGIL